MANAKILEKGLKLLEELAESTEGMTVVELADRIGVHKTSTYRYINSLLEMGYIQSDGDGRYHLGNKILELGSQLLRRMPLREVAHPCLVELSAHTQETVHLCVLDGHEVVYIDKVESYSTLPIISRIGSRALAYSTAVGKILLSELPTDQIVALLQKHPLQKLTPNTIIAPIKLLSELKKIAEKGYAIDDEENETGIMCISTPIIGYDASYVAAVSVTGIKREVVNAKKVEEIINALKNTVAKISGSLGYVRKNHG